MTQANPWKKAIEGKFGPALNELNIALGTMKTNEPINRREGNLKQADLERNNAKSFEAAMKYLEKA